jgi:hypothetical protein
MKIFFERFGAWWWAPGGVSGSEFTELKNEQNKRQKSLHSVKSHESAVQTA